MRACVYVCVCGVCVCVVSVHVCGLRVFCVCVWCVRLRSCGCVAPCGVCACACLQEMLKRVLAMATTAALVGAAVGKEVAWRA